MVINNIVSKSGNKGYSICATSFISFYSAKVSVRKCDGEDDALNQVLSASYKL
jgi:hypothetical protein